MGTTTRLSFSQTKAQLKLARHRTGATITSLGKVVAAQKSRSGGGRRNAFSLQNLMTSDIDKSVADFDQVLRINSGKPLNANLRKEFMVRVIDIFAEARAELAQSQVELAEALAELAQSQAEHPKGISSIEVQVLRDQVREMAAKERPLHGVPAYQGKRKHGPAVEFFKNHYAAYIHPENMVIYGPDLTAIDPKLMTALRNECRVADSPMPLGTRSDRTMAILRGRFSDGKMAQKSAKTMAWKRKAAGEEMRV